MRYLQQSRSCFVNQQIEAGLDGDLNPSSIYAAMIAAAPEPTLHMLESAWGDQSGGFAAAAAPPTNLSDARDAQRLRYVSDMMDGIGEIDFHERANEYAERAGADVATPGDDYYLAAVRDAIDAAIAALAAQGGTSK